MQRKLTRNLMPHQHITTKSTSWKIVNKMSDNHSNSKIPGLDLIRDLCRTLELEGINYCHFKSNYAIELSASGDNDLDLLINRAHAKRFTVILDKLGFTQAEAPPENWMPGVMDYYGFDSNSNKFVHVHAHYQLIVGHDLTKNYCLPIESAYLESAVQSGLFKVPGTEFEFILFVIRMNIKHSTWDAILIKHGGLSAAERQELAYFQNQIDIDQVNDLLVQHFPYVGLELFGKCLKALQPDFSIWERVKVGQKVQNALKAYSRRTQFRDINLKLWRRLKSGFQQRLFKRVPKRRLAAGGMIIAIVGGDGAGKSTVVNELYSWLSKDFQTIKVHLGKPDWSLTTISVRAILKIGGLIGIYPYFNSPNLNSHDSKPSISSGVYPWMLREICTARDRYHTYVKAKRFAINGGLVICDRFPLSQIKLMDGPAIEQVINTKETIRFPKYLISLENNYYIPIIPPELLLVLRVNPEIAVQRKTDEESTSVRERSTEIWGLNWEHTNARVIDASKSKADVLAEVKALIWSEL